MPEKGPNDARRLFAGWENGIVWLLILLFTWVTLRFALKNSDFIGDDYDHFQLVGSMPLLQYLFTPIDVHFVPLHRLFSWLLLEIAPLDFSLAVAVLTVFQLASTVMLALLLQRLRPGPWNRALIVLFACNGVLLPLLAWWSAGIHRLPYIFLSISCLYFYLGYRQQRRWSDLLGCWGCAILAFGFYGKAVLIPVYVLALEFCLSWRLGFAALRRYALGMAMLLAVGVYVGWYLLYAPVLRLDGPSSISTAIQIALAFMRILGGLLVLQQPGAWSLGTALIVAGWGVAILGTCLWRRENLVYWLALLGLVGLNFLMISGSSRGQLFGDLLALSPRYYFEVIFLVVIFLCLILNPTDASQRCAEGRGTRGLGVLTVCLPVLYAPLAYQAEKVQFSDYGRPHKQTHRYMQHVWDDLDDLPSGHPLRVAEGNLPLYVYGEWLHIFKPFAAVLPLRHPNLEFVRRDLAQYEIGDDGRVRPLPTP